MFERNLKDELLDFDKNYYQDIDIKKRIEEFRYKSVYIYEQINIMKPLIKECQEGEIKSNLLSLWIQPLTRLAIENYNKMYTTLNYNKKIIFFEMFNILFYQGKKIEEVKWNLSSNYGFYY